MRITILRHPLPAMLWSHHPVLSFQRNLSSAAAVQTPNPETEQQTTPPPASADSLPSQPQSQEQPAPQPQPSPAAEAQLFYPPSASQHTSLPTFLGYSERVGLNPSTTIYVGTHYEYTTIAALRRLGFSLQRVGGRDDFGIDLLGTWTLPQRGPLRVLVQCKVIKQVGPRLIRELDGAFVGAPSGWRGKGVIGLLVAEQTATKGIRDAMGRSKWPMVFVTCSRAGAVTQFLWNGKAAEEGLLDLAVGVRHRFVEGEEVNEVVLTCRGKSIPPVKEKKTRNGQNIN